MPIVTPFDNCYELAFNARNTIQPKWGKDQTGIIEYQFNSQGFRGSCSYSWVPTHAFFGNSAVFGVGVNYDKIFASQFTNAHNYGLSGNYMNWHSIENLKKYMASPFHTLSTKIVFVWIDRPEVENIPVLIDQVNTLRSNVLHITMGDKYPTAINLMPSIDYDVSGTHPGPKSHRMWAKTIKLLLNNV
mgnify:CR=1 FL=1